MTMHNVTLTITLSPQQVRRLLETSLERTLNSAIEVGMAAEQTKRIPPAVAEALVFLDDMEEMKPIATKLWDAARNAVRSK